MTKPPAERFSGPVGVWTFAFDRMPAPNVRAAAQAIERLGYSPIWVGEAAGREAFTHGALLLDATETLVVATGIARIGERSARATAAAQRGLAEAHPRTVPAGPGRKQPARRRRRPAGRHERLVDARGAVIDHDGLASLAAELVLTPSPADH